jgi:transposase
LLNLATETDIERLRQAALLLEQENARLFQRLERLAGELRDARGDEAQTLQLEIAHLKEQLASRTKALFGDSSERRTGSDSKAKQPKEPQPCHGPREQKALPSCGGALEPMTDQFEEADEIDVVERSFRVVRHKRQKYRCRCGAGIETALGPDKLVAGGRYSIDFAVDVAIHALGADLAPLPPPAADLRGEPRPRALGRRDRRGRDLVAIDEEERIETLVGVVGRSRGCGQLSPPVLASDRCGAQRAR